MIPDCPEEDTAEEHANACVELTFACALAMALAMTGYMINPTNIGLQFIMKEPVAS